MQFKKKHALILIAVAAIALYYYGSEQIENKYLDGLQTLGGGAYALNFLAKLAR